MPYGLHTLLNLHTRFRPIRFTWELLLVTGEVPQTDVTGVTENNSHHYLGGERERGEGRGKKGRRGWKAKKEEGGKRWEGKGKEGKREWEKWERRKGRGGEREVNRVRKTYTYLLLRTSCLKLETIRALVTQHPGVPLGKAYQPPTHYGVIFATL